MTLWPFQNVECHSRSYLRSHVAPRCSAAYCFHLLTIATVFLVPFFCCFASDNFWLKAGYYYEQPAVSFAHEVVLILNGAYPAASVGWSSLSELDALLPDMVRVPLVRSLSEDSNNDGVADLFRLTLDMPLGNLSSQSFEHIMLLAVYKLEFRERVQEDISGLVVLDTVAPSSTKGAWVRGQLRLHQQQPLLGGTSLRDTYATSPLSVEWSSSWAASNYPLTWRHMFDRYAAQNETASLTLTTPVVWDFTPSTSYRLEVIMDITKQPVQYIPGSAEVLKYAWMQFLSFLIPTWIVVQSIRNCVFDRQLVETWVVPRLPPRDNACCAS